MCGIKVGALRISAVVLEELFAKCVEKGLGGIIKCIRGPVIGKCDIVFHHTTERKTLYWDASSSNYGQKCKFEGNW